MVEDEILWEIFSGDSYLPMFKEVLEEELQMGVPPEIIRKWHFFLGYYLGNRPSHMLNSLAMMDRAFLNIPAEVVQRFALLLPQLVENAVFRTHVETLLHSLQMAMSR